MDSVRERITCGEMKECSICEGVFSIDSFVKDKRRKDGHGSSCLSCQRDKLNKWREDNHDKHLQQKRVYDNARYHRTKVDRAREIKDRRLKNRYGIGIEEFESMVASQNGRCKICDRSDIELVVDHCHSSGEIRGLLCRGCNLRLGHMEDIEWVSSAMSYLGGA